MSALVVLIKYLDAQCADGDRFRDKIRHLCYFCAESLMLDAAVPD